MIKLGKEKQNIKCDVHHCGLIEVEIKNQSGVAKNEKETICSSYELDNERVDK